MTRLATLLEAMAQSKDWSKTTKRAAWVSLLNQAVSSGSNFALTLYLVRTLATADFGLYGIGMAVAMLYAGIGDALLLTQMVVHVPEKSRADALPYAARMFTLLLALVGSTVLLTGALLFLSVDELLLGGHETLIPGIVAVSVSYLSKDFFVRHSYSARREAWALLLNTAIALSVVLCLLGFIAFGTPMTANRALWISAIGNMVGAVVGFALARLPMSEVRLGQVVQDALAAWRGGRWALGGVAVTWSQTQAYMYVAILFAGAAGAGLANTARVLITPGMFFVPAITQLVIPRLGSLRAFNKAAMLKVAGVFSVSLMLFAVAYSGILLVSIGLFAEVLIGQHDSIQIAPLALAWCLVMIFQFSRIGSVACLQVLKDFKLITLANVVSLLLTILIMLPLTKQLGIQGAVLGCAAGELIFSVLLFAFIVKKHVGNATG